MPALVAGHVGQPAEGAAGAGLDLGRHEGARAHEAHVTHEDVPELRQLVDGRGPEPVADRGDAAVALHRLEGPEALGIGHHGAELQAPEGAPAHAHALLAEQHRPAVPQLDGDGDQGPERRREDEAEARERHVERALAP